MQVLQTIPILRIFDLDKAKDFYGGFLGFQIDWEHRFDERAPAYLQVSRGALVLHLTEHHGDCCPGSTVYVETTALHQFHQEIAAKGYAYMRPSVEMAPWQAYVMEVTDPFGNRLRFSEHLRDRDVSPPRSINADHPCRATSEPTGGVSYAPLPVQRWGARLSGWGENPEAAERAPRRR